MWTSTICKLAKLARKGTLDAKKLKQAADKLNISPKELVEKIRAIRSSGGSQSAIQGIQVTDTMISWANDLVLNIGGEAVLQGLALEAAKITTASGGLLGLFGKIGSWFGLGTVAGGIIFTLALGLVTYGTANYLGARSGDNPVEPGKTMVGRKKPPGIFGQGSEQQTSGKGNELYAVYLLKNVSGGSIWIGQESTLNGKRICEFSGGGLCRNDGSDTLVQPIKKSDDYSSFKEAKRAYCLALKSPPKPMPLTGGSKADVYGGNYWVDTAPGCN